MINNRIATTCDYLFAMSMRSICRYCRNNCGRLNMIASATINMGIAKADGNIPWLKAGSADMRHFRLTTIGNGNNSVIVGGQTVRDMMKLNQFPLKSRANLVLSRSLMDDPHFREIASVPENKVKCFATKRELDYETLKYTENWVIGGEKVYREYINDDLTYMVITYVNDKYLDEEYAKFFPKFDNSKVFLYDKKELPNDEGTVQRYIARQCYYCINEHEKKRRQMS